MPRIKPSAMLKMQKRMQNKLQKMLLNKQSMKLIKHNKKLRTKQINRKMVNQVKVVNQVNQANQVNRSGILGQ
jgi:hypothetical protein